MGGGGGDTTTVQDIPAEFKPSFLSLFNSAFGAARTAAGQIPQNFFQPAPFPQTGPGFAPQAGAPQAQGGAQVGPGQPTPVPEQPPFVGGRAPQTPNTFDPSTGLINLGSNLSNAGPSGFNLGTAAVPLSQGSPIIGQAFPGPFIAGPDPRQLEALGAREDIARGLPDLGTDVRNLGLAQARGDFLDPRSNPFLQATIMSALRQPTETFFRQALPELQSQALQSGAFKGSSRRGFTENAAVSDLTRNLLDISGTLAGENLARERQLQQNAPQLISQGVQLQQIPSEILAAVGGDFRTLQQEAIQNQLLAFQEQQEAPFRPLIPLANIIRGTDIGRISTTTNPTLSPIASGLLGGLGGAAIGAGVGDISGNAGLGAGVGSLSGALAGFLT